jgi:hypothetical protein
VCRSGPMRSFLEAAAGRLAEEDLARVDASAVVIRGGWMQGGGDRRVSTQPRAAYDSAASRHRAAVARSLGWADEYAARGQYAEALGWVQVVEAVDEQLSVEFENKRRAWLSALAAGNARQGRAGERDDVLAEL